MSCYCTDTGEEKGRSLRRGRLCRSAGFCSVKFGLFPELHVSCGPQGVEKDLMAREWESEGSVLLCVTGPEMETVDAWLLARLGSYWQTAFMVCFLLISGFSSNAAGKHSRRQKVRTNIGIKSPISHLMLKRPYHRLTCC